MNNKQNEEDILKAMDANELLVKNRLYDLFLPLYKGVDADIRSEISWYEHRGHTVESAIPKILNKYQSILENNKHIIRTIVNFKNIWNSPDDFDDISYIDYLATEFSKNVSLLYNSDEVELDSYYVRDVIKPLMAYSIIKRLIHTPVIALLSAVEEKKECSLTIKEIALKYVYEKRRITRKNADEIVRLYGHKSGEKLFQEYTYYKSQANRRGQPIPWSEKKLKNKIALFKKVERVLARPYKEKILNDITILETMYSDNYE